MLSIVKSMALHGLDGKVLSIEVDISRSVFQLGGLSVFLMQVLRSLRRELGLQLRIQGLSLKVGELL